MTQLAFASCGEGVTTIAKEETPEKLTRADAQNGTRRADDGARSENAPDLFAHGAIRTGSIPFARCVAGAAEDCTKHFEASGLRSN